MGQMVINESEYTGTEQNPKMQNTNTVKHPYQRDTLYSLFIALMVGPGLGPAICLKCMLFFYLACVEDTHLALSAQK